jgi:hypothetical protein
MALQQRTTAATTTTAKNDDKQGFGLLLGRERHETE